MATGAERTGVMVVRVWLEDAHRDPLRVTLTSRLDVEGGEETRRTAGSVEAACEVLREWLEEFLAGAGRSAREPGKQPPQVR